MPNSESGMVLIQLEFKVNRCPESDGQSYPCLLAAPPFLAVGSGLLYSIGLTTSSAKLAGYQVILGASTGLGMQNSIVTIQVEFKDEPKLLAQAQSVGSFFQFLGGMVGLSVAEAVFSSELTRFLVHHAPDTSNTEGDQSSGGWVIEAGEGAHIKVVAAFTALEPSNEENDHLILVLPTVLVCADEHRYHEVLHRDLSNRTAQAKENSDVSCPVPSTNTVTKQQADARHCTLQKQDGAADPLITASVASSPLRHVPHIVGHRGANSYQSGCQHYKRMTYKTRAATDTMHNGIGITTPDPERGELRMREEDEGGSL
ncbi:hypothetical protein C8R45DRAFT_1076409 [Mycena sanguinolenta]|nr:hypothetical protein C8R45DRAFT_1076409 [Mycena sanguinolenta]